MGATLSARVQWAASNAASSQQTAYKSQATTDTHQTITSAANQDLFYELIHLIESLMTQHPAEAKAEFRRVLQWTSVSLRPAHFAAVVATQPGIWNIVSSGPKNTKASVASVATRSTDGAPLFTLDQVSGSGESAVFTAKVGSFEYLNRVLKIAEEMKLRELQDILQANQTPINTIFGVGSSSTSNLLIDAFEAFNTETDAKKKDANARLYKLLLIINSFDLDFLSAAVKNQERELHLDISKISSELLMLQSFSGKDVKCALRSISWESDYTFSNGFKAPPWRQVYSEIGYIEIQCVDADKFIVTCTKNGFFVNKGYIADDKGHEKLNYEKDSDLFLTLVDLIKSKSPHFEARIDKQDYLYQPDTASAYAAIANISFSIAAAADSKCAHDEDQENEADDNDADQDQQIHGGDRSRREARRNSMGKKK
ncbi:Armadillo repeat-containing protein 4 [Physocladia obscura]|uniref:Armadillo repeat-containing protein 4 n=1 Tax=Physocladia obscura TaxID=109957 RepID=A0AAD5T096_9FUNG|nr:Armadillo repeat-containing protein 4 [Physocladia obscura]